MQRYGADEVRRWWFETWNEANLGVYWKGTPEEFYKLHDYAVAGVRRALPDARVGGPDVAGHGGTFMEGFLDHVTTGRNYATGMTGTPTDFLAFHAKGAPVFADGHVRMGIKEQLVTIDQGFRMIAARPALRGKPIVIGESDPEGCAACQGPQLGYRNGTMYSSYTAAVFARKQELAARHGVNLQGALTWAFEFEDQPYFAGFRQLASNGIDLPVLNVFRMFSRMHGQRVPATSSAQSKLDDMLAHGVRGDPDVGVMASRSADELAVLVWHYHDDDVPGPGREDRARDSPDCRATSAAWFTSVSMPTTAMRTRPGSASVHRSRPTRRPGTHCARRVSWRRCRMLPTSWFPAGRAALSFLLPRQGVSLLIFSAR